MLHAERIKWKDLARQWRPRPDSGSVILDLFWLMILLVVEKIPMDDMSGRRGLIDLVTPWLVVSSVSMRPTRLILLALLSGLYRETHSTAPIGTYLAIHLMIALTMILVRQSMSWHHALPWWTALALSMTWVVLAESFVLAITKGPDSVPASLFAVGLVRIGISSVFGMYLCRSRLTLVPPPRDVDPTVADSSSPSPGEVAP